MNIYSVIDKNTREVVNSFNSRAEASYFITDVYGPEWNTVEVVEIEDMSEALHLYFNKLWC